MKTVCHLKEVVVTLESEDEVKVLACALNWATSALDKSGVINADSDDANASRWNKLQEAMWLAFKNATGETGDYREEVHNRASAY